MQKQPKAWMSGWRAKVMSTNSERITWADRVCTQRAWPLRSVVHTRQLEAQHASHVGTSLMHEAGLALARLTLALAPHANIIWIACGPGNNGGDGVRAAIHLQQWGKNPIVTLVHDPLNSPPDARQAWADAQLAGVATQPHPPDRFDVCLDALFGIGMQRPITGTYADWVEHMNAAAAPTIAVDIPSGLDADHGNTLEPHVRANATLSLLTLKPGLFTAHGRDACGEVWFNTLGVEDSMPTALLLGGPPTAALRPHASHKGTFGDVAIVGGAPGMAGAALLAARSASHGGAGRVFVCLLDEAAAQLDLSCPELMFRATAGMDWSTLAVVAGCGGAGSIADHLPRLLAESRRLVLDADALNQIAQRPDLQALTAQRPADTTVLTPHPLEAARLLGVDTADVQSDRVGLALQLAAKFHSVVVLKGSGTVVCSPQGGALINPTGNARLATAGTGDVLAGLIGSYLAQGMQPFDAASAAVYRHGLAAERWQGSVLVASELCQRI